MLDRPVEQLTLRERFIAAERLTRELIDHLDQGFAPKAEALKRVVRAGLEENPHDDVRDVTIRTRAFELLESEAYTNQLYEKTERYFSAIESGVAEILQD